MRSHFVISLKILLLLTLVLGLIYPVAMTLVAQNLFKHQAKGSLVEQGGRIIGSRLLAQKTVSDKYFWPRPSASDYGANPSGASNLGYTSKALKQAVDERRANGFTDDLLFASASGLDPHISINAAFGQVDRVVQARSLSESQKDELIGIIQRSVEKRDFGLFGEPRINVLVLNIELDKAYSD